MTPVPTSRIAYMPALDGLRALAVIAVLAYHGGMPWARGGFLGVDAFFVISGFLITSLLLAEHAAAGRINLRSFWVRRMRRLLPALLLVLVGVAVYAAWFADARELATIRADSVATIAYAANWKPIVEGDSYFDQFAVPSPLMHTWSLAIEEQWYVVWPIALLLALKFRPPAQVLIGGTAVLAIASAVWMAFLYAPDADPSRVYYGTDTRAQSLLLGAALAMLLSRAPRPRELGDWRVSGAAIAALCVLAASWVFVHADTTYLYRGGFLFLALITCALTAAISLAPQSFIARTLGSGPMRAVGLISYGLYLWHWPLFILLTPDRTGLDGYGLFGLRVAVTAAVATVSYLLVEQPIRHGALGRLPRMSWALAPAAAVAAVAVVFVATRNAAPVDDAVAITNEGAPPVAAQAETAAGGARVLVVGDSVAFTAGQGLGRAGEREGFSVWNQGRLGCGVLRGDRVLVDGRWTEMSAECNDWAERWQSYVDLYRPDAVVVLAGAWDVQDREVGGEVLEFGSARSVEFARGELRAAMGVLSSRGARVFLLTTPRFEQPDLALVSASPRFDEDRIDLLNAIYAEVAHDNTSVEVVDLAAFLADAGSAADGDVTSDGVHFTDAGADMVAEWLAPRIEATAAVRTESAAAATVVQSPTTGARWVELLGMLPETQGARRGIAFNDYARFREVFGMTPPEVGDGRALADDRTRLMFDAAGQRTGLSPAPLSGFVDEGEAYAGVATAAVQYDAWSTDGELQFVATTDGSETMCQPACSDEASLLEGAPEYAVLAEALSGTDAYAVLLSLDTASFEAGTLARAVAGPDATSDEIAAAEAQLRAGPLLEPFRAVATAASNDGDGAALTIALLHDTAEAAEANVEVLRRRVEEETSWLGGRPFVEMLEVMEIRTDGGLLVARLRTTSAGYWFGLVSAHDTLLLHR